MSSKFETELYTKYMKIMKYEVSLKLAYYMHFLTSVHKHSVHTCTCMYVLHNYLPLGIIREVQGLPITDNCLNRFK